MYPNIELAELDNKELVYGTYEEIEEYADKQKTWVFHYFDHVNPSTVYKHFRYIGKEMSDPYAVSTPFDYRAKRQPANFNTAGVNTDKW